MRVDATAVETNIHKPFDSHQLWDCVRVLTRYLSSARSKFHIKFQKRTKRAHSRFFEIQNTRGPKRLAKYRDLIKVCRDVLKQSKRSLDMIPRIKEAIPIIKGFENFIPLMEKVIDQTVRRVFNGESVPAAEKITSIFEPHTDILTKKNRQTVFGHKITISAGQHLVFDCVIEDGNPADSTRTLPMIERHEEIFGRVPESMCFDGAYASCENLRRAKGKGVVNVVFQKRRGLKIEEMAISVKKYKSLRRFRAGIEGLISNLKRSIGLRRCTWRGLDHFKQYVWASIFSSNMLKLARCVIQSR